MFKAFGEFFFFNNIINYDSDGITSKNRKVPEKIHRLLTDKGMTQKELARKMGKTEAEVSVWLSGQHNFTLRTLAKISVILGEDLILFS